MSRVQRVTAERLRPGDLLVCGQKQVAELAAVRRAEGRMVLQFWRLAPFSVPNNCRFRRVYQSRKINTRPDLARVADTP